MNLLAIDPGAKGGFAFRNDKGVVSEKLPETEGDILLLIEMFSVAGPGVCYLEQLVKYAGTRMPGSAMATYASSWGFLKGVAMARGWRLVLVTPQKWQKTLGLGVSTGDKTTWKNKLKAMAQQLYPGIKVTLANADALLILRYAELEERTPL
jgi:hypothetical protein